MVGAAEEARRRMRKEAKPAAASAELKSKASSEDPSAQRIGDDAFERMPRFEIHGRI